RSVDHRRDGWAIPTLTIGLHRDKRWRPTLRPKSFPLSTGRSLIASRRWRRLARAPAPADPAVTPPTPIRGRGMSARAVGWNPSSADRTVTPTPSATAAAYAA